MARVHHGLRDIYVAKTKISGIINNPPRLFYREHDITSISRPTFEKIAYLLIYGGMPDNTEYHRFRKRILDYRKEFPLDILDILHQVCIKNTNVDYISLLRKGICLLSLKQDAQESIEETGIKLLSWMPVLTGAVYRIKNDILPWLENIEEGDLISAAYLQKHWIRQCGSMRNTGLIILHSP